ncbi:TRAP transporter small permease [Methylopila sp. Yamaguchi]|uniref:TRAP transporter small permease n=1 Tax=Methylopila sp. Yamaguchi TaxID=1437817 RepID=UPI000CCACED9|nr:TRAP transporter small permease subunit [Methylopila sp. Yamaguchi]GBD49801.1 tripartite ATP-independent periplasmic transporter DctQ [Methylopila sp. Yamaguchi]
MTALPPERPEPARGGPALRAAHVLDAIVGHACRFVVLATGTTLLVLLTSNVVARYVLAGGGFEWAQELPERMFPWFIMAGVALAVQKGGHMAVETLLPRLDRMGVKTVLLLGHAIVIASYVVLCAEAIGVADIVSIETSPVLGMPSSTSYYALALGCVAVILATLAIALRVGVLGPEAMPAPAPEEIGV